MAGASLLALLDDIAAILDDVALMTKVAAKKTAGVLGDDLALNAQQVAGVRAERELPVVWAVAVGSLRNKLILVPAALAISAVIPAAVTPLLMAGGLFLCFEGMEKLTHKAIPCLHGEADTAADSVHVAPAPGTMAVDAEPSALGADIAAPGAEASSPGAEASAPGADTAKLQSDPAALEAEKIRGAIRTDFVLSAEIIVIALGTVADQPFGTRLAVLAGIGVLMTVGVYGIVAAIVKLDDLGLHLGRSSVAATRAVGRLLVLAAPRLMKALTVVGTAAMFLVGGSILAHGLPFAASAARALAQAAGALPLGQLWAALAGAAVDLSTGLAAGALAVATVTIWRRPRRTHA